MARPNLRIAKCGDGVPTTTAEGDVCSTPPHEHDVWEAQQKSGARYVPPDYRAKAAGAGADSNNSSQNSDDSQSKMKLTINERLKSVLCGQLMLSDADAENLSSQIMDGK